jgi:hypothetical protein
LSRERQFSVSSFRRRTEWQPLATSDKHTVTASNERQGVASFDENRPKSGDFLLRC